MNPAPQGDAANAQFAGHTLAFAAQSHPARADADARRVSPAGSAAADDLDVVHEEEQPPQAEANMIHGVHYPPPSAFLKHILQGKTDPYEVMHLTSMYFREYDNKPSKYGSEDYSTVSKISSKSPQSLASQPASHVHLNAFMANLLIMVTLRSPGCLHSNNT
ncbi:TPA: hypothetical protein ACH3X1_008189 [Trebouxia sp. C0004]